MISVHTTNAAAGASIDVSMSKPFPGLLMPGKVRQEN
jgi:hypothetical protein